MPSHTLGQQMLRTASIFQGIAATIATVFQAVWVIDQFYGNWDTYKIYDATTAICSTLLAAAILFSVVVQRNQNNTPFSIWCLEAVKSSCATALWLWLILDAIFGPNCWGSRPYRDQRISMSAVSVLIILIGFYPTLVYAYLYRKSEESLIVDDEREGERRPLLRA